MTIVHALCMLDIWGYKHHFFYGAATQRGSWPPHSWGFLEHTQRRTTVGRTPLDEWSARRRDLYLTTHDTHNRQTSMPQVGFEPTISASERPQAYALDRADKHHLGCVILTAFTLQQCLYARASLLCHMHICCLVSSHEQEFLAASKFRSPKRLMFFLYWMWYSWVALTP